MATKTSICNLLAERAEHYDNVGPADQAARFYRMVGERALAGYDSQQALSYLQRALALTPDDQAATRYDILLLQERVLALQADRPAQIRALSSLESLAHNLGDDGRQAEVALRQAQFKLATGDYPGAVTISQLALRLAQIIKRAELQAGAQLCWGQALLQQGDYDGAQVWLSLALEGAQANGLAQLEAGSLRSLGVLAVNQNNFSQARHLYEQASGLYERAGDKGGQAGILNNLGSVAHAQGDFAAARRFWGQASDMYAGIGDRAGQSKILSNLGTLAMDLGDYEQARVHTRNSLKLCRQIKLRFGVALALINLSLVHHRQGTHNQAYDLAWQAIELAGEMGNRRLQGCAQTAAGHALSGLEKGNEAADAYWQSLAVWFELEQPNLVMESYAGLARVAMQQRKPEQARLHVEQIMAHLDGGKSLAGTESPLRIYLTCYQILKRGNDPRAEGVLQRAHRELQARAGGINDDKLKDSFLNNVAAHREILNEVNSRDPVE